MLPRFGVGVLIIVLIAVALSSSQSVRKSKGSDGGTRKIRRQHSSRLPDSSLNVNPSSVEFKRIDDGVVQYDPSGLGFEFKLPFQDNFEAQHVKPDDGSITPDAKSKAEFQENNPVYHTSPNPEATHPPSSTQAPAYIEFPFDAPIVPAYFSGFSVPKPSYNLETPPDNSYTTIGPGKYNNKYPYYCPKVGGYESQCRPTKDCSVWYDLVLITPDAACKLPDGEPGTCCPELPYNSMYSPSKFASREFTLI